MDLVVAIRDPAGHLQRDGRGHDEAAGGRRARAEEAEGEDVAVVVAETENKNQFAFGSSQKFSLPVALYVKNVWGTRILSVCLFVKYTFQLLDGVFTPKLLLPARKRGQQQGALIICTKNV
jgi:hypothetical protein